jgi:hypothetical protein
MRDLEEFLPIGLSQIRALLSALAVASRTPSGLNATAETHLS